MKNQLRRVEKDDSFYLRNKPKRKGTFEKFGEKMDGTLKKFKR